MPAVGNAADSEEYGKADHEVNQHSEVVFTEMPRGHRQVWHEQEVHNVPCQHGNQGVREIHSGWF